MDKDFFFYEDYIREAQRQRSKALGQLLADGCGGAKRLVIRVARTIAAHLMGPQHPLPR